MEPMRDALQPRSVLAEASGTAAKKSSAAKTAVDFPSSETTPKGRESGSRALPRRAVRVAACKAGRTRSGSSDESASRRVVSGTRPGMPSFSRTGRASSAVSCSTSRRLRQPATSPKSALVKSVSSLQRRPRRSRESGIWSSRTSPMRFVKHADDSAFHASRSSHVALLSFRSHSCPRRCRCQDHRGHACTPQFVRGVPEPPHCVSTASAARNTSSSRGSTSCARTFSTARRASLRLKPMCSSAKAALS